MSEKILLNTLWRFHDGEIETDFPTWKGPLYAQAKHERYLGGPAAVHYPDAPNDFCARAGKLLPRPITLERWENVTLPHDYVIGGTPSRENNEAEGFLRSRPAWYRKHFTLTEEDKGKCLRLYFEGVSDRCEIYLNGTPLYENLSGWTPFEVDITDIARFESENVLAVHILPQIEGWWYGGSGIYRNVWLEKSAHVAIARYGIYVAPRLLGDGKWLLPVQNEVQNASLSTSDFEVKTHIFDPNGNEIVILCATGSAEARETATVKSEATIDAPMLWDLDTPSLYRAMSEVLVNGEIVDTAETTFGFRHAVCDPDRGFLLNGRPVKLKGICGHGDFGLTGKAVPDSIHRYKVKLMKEMGANAYRTAHYPQAEVLMDEFDRRGILVMDETRWFSSSEVCIRQLRTLIRRDRNHPSVIFWSVGNEENVFQDPEGTRIFRTLKCEVSKLDDTRPILVANDKAPMECTVYPDTDVIGLNYNLGAYDPLHEKYPDKAIVSSECCATASTRGWYFDASPAFGRTPAYDRESNLWYRGREETWKFIAAREWLMGGFQWAGFEHRGESEWPRICSQSGAIDLFLLKKDAFYQNMSHWTKEPMIHLLPHWNHAGREGELITVFAYTNCPETELFLNGKSLGRQTLDLPAHGEWKVPFEAGTLEAVGYMDGKAVVTDRRITTKKPTRLALRAENAGDVRAGDMLMVTCYCVDEDGLAVPDAAPTVRFHTNGLGLVVGTGSSCTDHVPVTAAERKMYAGEISVAVSLGNTEGTLRLYADADDLALATLTLEIQK